MPSALAPGLPPPPHEPWRTQTRALIFVELCQNIHNIMSTILTILEWR